MAILEDLGLEVKIVVNDSPLQEYEENEQEPTNDDFGDEIRKYRCYVEVVDNAEFAVLLRATSTNKYLGATKALRFAIDLDGQDEIENRLLDSDYLTSLVEGKVENDGQETRLRRFRFTVVSTVDDDDTVRVNKGTDIAAHLGLLRVRVWRAEIRDSEESSTQDSDSSVPSSPRQTTRFDDIQSKFSEKALKGKSLSHRATLSAAVPCPGYNLIDFKYVDPVEVPLAIFYLKYRSRDILQQKLIIPREPSQVDVDIDSLPLREICRLAKVSVDTLPFNEVRRLAQRQLSHRQEGDSTSEVAIKCDSSRGAVKREPGEDQVNPRPRKIVKLGNGREAVDLTEDD